MTTQPQTSSSPHDNVVEEQLTVYHLEMTNPSELRPARKSRLPFQFVRAERPSPAFNRFLYTAVGGHWRWTQRLDWSWEKWLAWLDRRQLETWVAWVDGTPAGYCEMEHQPEQTLEIVSFGLLPQFIGHGLGGALLTRCVERAWAAGAQRVWLHTCTLDHPHALPAYQARGFRLFKTEVVAANVPQTPLGPWPGALPG